MKIYAIPGLGTNGEVFLNIQVKGHEIVPLKWPKPINGITLTDYAKLFIDQINVSEPFMLMGLSLGGMISVELSKLISPKKTILISSCKVSTDLPFIVKFVRVIPIHKIIPESWYRLLQCYCGPIIGLEKKYRPELRKMLVDIPENYFGNMVDYLARWESKETPSNCILIHGNRDKVVKFNKNSADYLVNNGTHAMIISKAEEINSILEKYLRDFA